MGQFMLGLVKRGNRKSSDFLAQAPEVRVEKVSGGTALSGIDALVFTD
jgi:hypothetical protein